jgi:hypothetical protein
MDGEAIQTISGSDRIGVVTDGKGLDYVRKALESSLMSDGVHVQAISIEDIKDDFYQRDTYDVATNVLKKQKTSVGFGKKGPFAGATAGGDTEGPFIINTETYDGMGALQSVNDYTLRSQLTGDSLTFLGDLRSKWGLDYILVVHQKGAFSFESYLLDTGTREKLFTLYVNANKKGFFKDFPDTKNRPSIDEWSGTNDGDLARQEVARYIVQTLLKGPKKAR